MEATLGTPRRLRTIYNTNLRTTRAAARYRAQAANAESRPFWMYDTRDDARTRPSHRALDGRVFRHDDPLWRTHYPPNGWNCRCRVRALTPAQTRARGLHVADSAGMLHDVEQVVGVDRRTGEEIRRPAKRLTIEAGTRVVSLTPDPGWNHNPGMGRPLFELEPSAIGPAVGDAATWRNYGLPPVADTPPALRLPAPPALPRQPDEARALDALASALGVRAGRPPPIVPTPDGMGDVAIRREYLRHIVAERGQARERTRRLGSPSLPW